MSTETPLEQQLLGRDDLLKPYTRRYKVVGPLPVRGGYVRLQSITELEASVYESTSYDKGTLVRARMQDANRRYIAMCLVDQAGNRLLSPQDVGKLAEWDRADVSFLYTEAHAHANANRSKEDDLEKNCNTTPAGN